METSPPAGIYPLLLRNVLLPLFIFADKSLLKFINKFKLLQFIRHSLLSFFLFSLRFLSEILPSFNHDRDEVSNFDFPPGNWPPQKKSVVSNETSPAATDSLIARALSQLLSIVNEIPVSSRKYEIVRSYAERLISDNLEEGHEPLRRVNIEVLAAAFSRTLGQLESAAEEQAEIELQEDDGGGGSGDVVKPATAAAGYGYFGLNRMIRKVGKYGDAAWTRFGKSAGRRRRRSAEKLSAELLWLAQKLAACGGADEAVYRWGSASKLAWLALAAQPRLQGFLVTLSAFLLKEAKNMGNEECDGSKREEQRQLKMKMLTSWIPFLCRASNGLDAPVLSMAEKAEVERVLGDLIESLQDEEEQEKVLSLWLQHFTHCPSSDWPNLHSCYTRWCAASRKLLILQGSSED